MKTFHSPQTSEARRELRQKHLTGTQLIRVALEAASKLSTCQGCPDENLSVVVMAMDALKVVDTVEEVLRYYTIPSVDTAERVEPTKD